MKQSSYNITFALMLWLGACFLAIFALAHAIPAEARISYAAPQAPAIRLRAATFVPSLGQVPALPKELMAERASDAGMCQYLVQFEGPILHSWQLALEAAGAKILDYIPDYAYKVNVECAALAELERLPGVVWVGVYHPAYRLSPDLAPKGRQAVIVELDHANQNKLLAYLPALGIRWIGQEGRMLAVEAEPSGLAALSKMSGVKWIAPLHIPRLHNDVATREIRAHLAWNMGLAGERQVINIADTGLDTGVDYPQIVGDMHRDVDNRVAHLRSWPISPLYYGYLDNPLDDDGAADLHSGHGTHVAGCAVGNGYRSDGRYRGVAYRATLTFQALEQYGEFNPQGEARGFTDGYWLLGVPADLAQLYAEAYGWGARVHSNSWGAVEADLHGIYTAWSQQTDRFVWEHRDMSIVFSTGNMASDANRDGRADYGSVGPPATAKNIIAVGGVENRRPALLPIFGYQNYGQLFSSAFTVNPIRDDPMADAGIDGMFAASGRGPSRDGRLIPNVVAPATWVASMRSSRATKPGWDSGTIDNYYMYLGGTSMSAPLVAGSVALIRQAYMARGHAPSAALLKATLIQTARDIPGQYPAPFNEAGPIPNNDEGWGVVDVEAAVSLRQHWVDQRRSLRTGERATYIYQANASQQPAKFTLVWSDYPAAVEAAVQLVNDLDLEVIAPNGEIYRGNVFSAGWSTTGGSPDRINNVECVYLPSTQAGTYQVIVRGHNVPRGPQDFALLAGIPSAQYVETLVLPLILRDHRLPMPTHTPTASPTPTATPMLTPTIAPGEFRDNFSSITGMWVVTSTSAYALGYADGEYRIRVYSETNHIISLPAITQTGSLTLEVEGRAANDVLQAYGLIFNYQAGAGIVEYRAFLVAPTGYYALARWRDGQPSIIVDWSPSDAIAIGTGTNRLTLHRVGQQVTCLINGIQVAALSRPEFIGGDGFGLIVVRYGLPNADVYFDNFRMLPRPEATTILAELPGMTRPIRPQTPR